MLPKRALQNKPGLTVIELLIAMSVFAIVGVILSNILITENSSFREQQARNKLIVESLRVMNPLRQYSLAAKEILPTYTYGVEEFSTDADTIILQLPAINVSDDIIPAEFDTVIFDTSNTVIRFILDPSAQSVRSSQDTTLISTLHDSVIRYNNETIADATQFTFTVQLRETVSPERIQSYTQTGTFSLRNIIPS